MTNRHETGTRHLAAILMLDVAGFSAMMGRDDEATTRRVVAFHAVVRTLVEAHGGRVVKTSGDSVFGEFESIVGAVEGAIAIQRHLADRDPGEGERLMARIGLHVGDVIVQGDDLYGDGVNIAARLEPLAEPGGLAVSEAVFLGVGARLGLPFDDDGFHQLKNIDRPVRVYRVSPSAFGFASVAGAVAAPPAVPAVPKEVDLAGLTHTIGGPAETIIGAMSEAIDERLREKGVRRSGAGRGGLRARPVPTPTRLLISAGFLVEAAIGVFLILARTTGWTTNGAYPFVGCLILGTAVGSLGQSITRRRGLRAFGVAVGVAVGALCLGNVVMRVVLWVIAVGFLAIGLQRFGTKV